MLVQLVLCALVAAGLSPCVVQRACPARPPRPPSSVCMHLLDATQGIPSKTTKSTKSTKKNVNKNYKSNQTLVVSACTNCVMLGKEEKAMFRAHSEACLPRSRVDPKLVEALLNGELSEEPALKQHVYCVLLKCKVVGKDGKLLKTAVLGKLALRSDGRQAGKVLEQCAEQSAASASSPEEVAWNLFRCGYERKAVLFDYMPTGAPAANDEAM